MGVWYDLILVEDCPPKADETLARIRSCSCVYSAKELWYGAIHVACSAYAPFVLPRLRRAGVTWDRVYTHREGELDIQVFDGEEYDDEDDE